MMTPPLSRRDFLVAGSAAALAAAVLPRPLAAASGPQSWPIGCFNRPWTKWSYDEALDAIKGAGYRWTGLLTPTKDDPFTNTTATPQYLAAIKRKIADRGLKVNMTALRVKTGAPLQEAIDDTRRQLDNGAAVGVEFALTFGEDKPERYAAYYQIMTDAAAHAQKLGIKLVIKPHGGGSGASEEILRCLKEVGHPNFKVWFDAGNIVYYTGKDPVAELRPIVQHVTGLCAKDCVVEMVNGKPKPDVMVQFGTGKVNFQGVFQVLKAAGFNGPIMVECCKIGATPQETMANARANREYLEKVLASV